MKKLRGLVVLAPAFALAWAADVAADDTFCPPNLGVVTVDNVIATGGGCSLSRTTVQGNVKAEAGSDLRISGGTVGGSVQGEAGSSVLVFSGTVVGGDVQCNEAVGPFGCNAQSVSVGGIIQTSGTQGGLSVAFASTVGGDVQVFDSAVRALVGLNTIGGNLQCEGNAAVILLGGANVVGGNKEGQCSGPGF